MTTTLTIRLDDKFDRELSRLAKRTGRSSYPEIPQA
ncbi:MAG: ribbon-helix-helix protein, CopG family [Burkholderiales bacterium]